jgi:aryl-alcohol dehydrogenase-like predicted oxidoreductase
VLLGPVTVEQLRSNLRALDVRVDPALLVRVERLRQDPAEYWRQRAALTWT